MGEKIFVLVLFTLIVIGVSIVLYHITKCMYYGLKVYYTNPFRGKEHPFIHADSWSDPWYGYHFVDGIWYKGHAEKDWEEAKFSEPVNTLLTLIHQDFENFVYTTTKTDSGNIRYIQIKHNKLNIEGKLDLYETGNSLNMFGNQIHIKKSECSVIRDFFICINSYREERAKDFEIKRLQAEREASKEYIVEGIQEYLNNKENL